jgi:hypothetical protein
MPDSDQQETLATAALLVVHEMIVGLNELLVADMPHQVRAVFAQAFTDIEYIIHQTVPADVAQSQPLAVATAAVALDQAATNVLAAAALSHLVKTEPEEN